MGRGSTWPLIRRSMAAASKNPMTIGNDPLALGFLQDDDLLVAGLGDHDPNEFAADFHRRLHVAATDVLYMSGRRQAVKRRGVSAVLFTQRSQRTQRKATEKRGETGIKEAQAVRPCCFFHPTLIFLFPLLSAVSASLR